MGKINDARKAQLKSQIEFAVVEHIGTEANDYPSWDVGTYSVFIPGAIREYNMVTAADEEEAKQKVLACLEHKIDALPETDAKTDNVSVSPNNLKIETKGKVTGGNNG